MLHNRICITRFVQRAVTLLAAFFVIFTSGAVHAQQVPLPPTNVVATAGDGVVNLSWSTTANTSYYYVYRSTTQGTGYAYVAYTTAPSYQDTGRSVNTPYYYIIKSNNATGFSPASSEVACTLSLAPPTGITATAGDGLVNLSWTAAASNDYYYIYRSTTQGSGYTYLAYTTTTSYQDTGRSVNTPYYYIIKSNNTGGYSAASAEVACTLGLAPPTGITATPGNGTISLAWTAAANADYYYIYRSTTPGSGYAYVAYTSSAVTTYNDTGRANNTPYYYIIKSNNAGGYSSPSAEVSCTITLSPPVNFRVTTLGDGQVSLAWDGAANASNYFLYKSTATGGPYNYITNMLSGVTTYNDIGLSVNTPYFYVLKSYNAGGYSNYSSELPVTLSLAAPANLRISGATTSSVTLAWSAAVSADYYQIFRSTTSGSGYSVIASTTQPTTSYTDTAYNSSSAVYYVVVAGNNGGTSAHSNEVSPAASYVAPPQGLTATAGIQQVSLSWSAVASATGYNVKRGSTSTGPYTTIASGVTGVTYADTSAQPNTTYHYVVTAVAANGESAPSNDATATPTSYMPAPTNVAAIASDGAVGLTWTGDPTASGFIISKATTAGGPYTSLGGGSSTYFTDNDVTDGTTYYYVVSAQYASGQSDPSAEAAATPSAAPDNPTGLVAVAGDGQVTLGWNAVTGAISYNVKRSLSDGGPYTQIVAQSGTTYNDTSVTNGTGYFYVVSAILSGTETANSDQAVAEPLTPATINAVPPQYSYTADGLRAFKPDGSGGRTYFLYDGETPICELDGTGAVTATNTFGATGLISRRTSAGSTFYLFDPQGNVVSRTDSNANILGTYAFDAFGLRTGTDSSDDPYSFFEGQFGYYHDAETGLELLTHRYYDAGTGRFVNRDPIGYSGGIDLYAYCNNNPVVNADPSGYLVVPDPSSAYSYWMNVAEAGETEGGVVGNAKAAGASLMTSFIDYFGARNVQRDASVSADRFSHGETAAGIGYGTFTAAEILCSGFALWTPGGGVATKGVGLTDLWWYEIGSKTVPSSVYTELAQQGIAENKVALGRLLWKKHKLGVYWPWGKLKPKAADWRITFPEGPTPGGYAGGTLLTRWAQQYLRNHCPEDMVR